MAPLSYYDGLEGLAEHGAKATLCVVGIPVVSGPLLGSRGNRCSSWWLSSSANGRSGAPMLESSVDLIESLAPTY